MFGHPSRWSFWALLALVTVGISACGGELGVRVDGSSTVYPVSLAMAEEFTIEHPGLPVSVAYSGTGGGLSKMCAGALDVADASRVVKASELATCAAAGISLIELPVAADALTIVVNRANDFVTCLTLTELAAIWAPGSGITKWSQVRAGFPDADITLYGPGTDSGTFDYFTEAVNGQTGAIRTDFFPSEDDNVLVQGVESDPYAMGFFGYAYYAENSQRLTALAVDSGHGCVAPTPETIEANSYTPLSRPLFIYVSTKSLEAKQAVTAFIDFYLAPANREYIAGTGFVTYPPAVYEAVAARFKARVTGTAFADFHPGDSVLAAVLAHE